MFEMLAIVAVHGLFVPRTAAFVVPEVRGSGR